LSTESRRMPHAVAQRASLPPKSSPGFGLLLYRGALSRPALAAYSFLLFIVVWQVISALIVRDPVFLPTPAATLATLHHYLRTPFPTHGSTLIEDTGISLVRILIGFACGSAVGLILGSLIAGVRVIRAMLEPFIQMIRPLPPIAFIPLLLIWFGLGETPKYILVAFGVVPIVTVATAGALSSVPRDLLNTARCLGASERYIMVHVSVRAAIPGVITGLRLAMGTAWTGIVTVEFLAASSGLGYLIYQAGQNLQTSLVFAGLACIGLLGLTLDTIFRLSARALDPTSR
jgi:taurine transport system permease protein